MKPRVRATLVTTVIAASAVSIAAAAWGLQRLRSAPVAREAGLNVLLITIDTLRADAVSAYGGTRARTPWIDRLATAGVRFENARAHNVLTLPSHANILSGRYPFQHGVRENAGFRFPAEVDTLATLLRAAGYRTGAFVSGFPLDSRFGLERGFDVYEDSFADARGALNFELPERRGSDTVALARQFIERADGPHFSFVHLYDPHTPYRPPEPFASRHPADAYFGEVEAADAALEPLLAPLLSEGRAGRTLVVLTADHGEGLGDHGERTHGFFAYDTTLRVPLVLYAPRLLRPRVVSDAVRHIDLVPTILDLLARPDIADLPGRSLVPLASGARQPPATSYFEALSGVLTRGWAPLHGVVHGAHKYIDLPLPELYDVQRDPVEALNLVAREPEPVDRLGALLHGLRAQDRGVRTVAESAETRERLAALGYVSTARAPPNRRFERDDDPKLLIGLDDRMQDVVRRQLQGDVVGALRACEEVVAARPGMLAGWLQLAHVQKKLGRSDAALASLNRAFSIAPDDTAVAILLATLLSETGDAAEAARLLSAYAEDPAAPVDVLVTRGVALAQLGRAREALEMFERARRADPSNPMTQVQIATLQLSAGRTAQARAAVLAALAINEHLALAQHTLGLVALRERDREGAETAFRAALAIDAGEVDALLKLGWLLADSARGAEARACFERFLELAPPELFGGEIARVRAWLHRVSQRATT